MNRLLLLAAIVVAASPQWSAGAETSGAIAIPEIKRDVPVDFAKEIAPVLKQKCAACHNATNAESDFSVESAAAIKKGGSGGAGIVPGKSSESLLLLRASGREEPKMPPPDNKVNAKPLTPEELGLIKLWIEQGAKAPEVESLANVEWQPLPGGVSPIYAVALSRDGQFAACGRGNRISIYHLPSARHVETLTDPSLAAAEGKQPAPSTRDLVQSLAFSPDGYTLASGEFRAVKIWTRAKNARFVSLEDAGAADTRVLAASADGHWLASSGVDTAIQLWDLNTGKLARTLNGHSGVVTALAFDAKGDRLFSASEDRTLRTWNVADGAAASRIETPQPLAALAVLDDARIVTADAGNALSVWRTGALNWKAYDLPAVTAIASNPKQKIAATGHGDGAGRVLDATTGATKHALAAHQGAITALSLQPNGMKLATLGADNLFKIWNASDGARLKTLSAGSTQSAVSISPDGASAVTAGADGLLRVWNLNANGAKVLGEPDETAATAFAVSPDGKWTATCGTASGAPAIVVRDVATGAVARTLVGHQAPITAVAFNRAGDRIASGSNDMTARVWNLSDGALVAAFAGHGAPITTVNFNTGGTQIVSGAANGGVKIWNVANATEVRALAGHTAAILHAAFTPDNQNVVTAALDQTARIWNSADESSLRTISTGVAVTAASLSRDGTLIALAGADRQTRVYKVADGGLSATLKDSPEKTNSLSFSADGKRLVTAGGGQPSVVWYLPGAAVAETLVTTGGGAFAGYVGETRDVCVATTAKTIIRHAQGCERLIAAPAVNGVAFTPDSNRFLASSSDGNLRAVTIEGEVKFTIRHSENANAVALSPDGKTFATGGDDQTIRLWNAETGAAIRAMRGLGSKVRALAFSPDGARLIAGGNEQSALFDATSGMILQRYTENGGAIAVGFANETGDAVIALATDQKLRSLPAAAIAHFPANEQPVTALAAFPGAPNEVLSASLDGVVRRWNVSDGKLIRTYPHGAPIVALAARPDGKAFATCGADRSAKVWGMEKGELLFSLRGDARKQQDVKAAERRVALATDNAQFLAAAMKESETRAAAEKAALDKAVAALTAADKASAEKAAAAQKAAEEKAATEKAAADAAAAQKSADDAKAAAAKMLADATAAMQAATSAKAAADQAAADAQAKLAAAQKAADDANKLATEKAAAAKAAADAVPAKVKAATDAEAARAAADSARTAATRVKDSATTATARADESLAAAKKISETAQENVKKVTETVQPAKAALTRSEVPLLAAAFSPDGQTLAVAGADKRVHTFDAASGAPREIFEGHSSAVLSLTFAGARALISGGGDSAPIAWDTASPWRLERTIGGIDDKAFVDRVTALAFSPDGKLLATGGGDPSRRGELKLWNVADGSLAREIPDAHSDVVLGVDFSVDGKLLASGGADKFVKIHAVENGAFVRSFEGHTGHVLGVSWRSNGRAIASAGADNTVKVWNVVTGDQAATIPGFPKEVTSVGFIGDTPNVVSSSGDANVRVHNSENAAGVRTLSGAKDFTYSAAVSFDGKRVISGGQDATLRVWDNESGKLLNSFEPEAAKN